MPTVAIDRTLKRPAAAALLLAVAVAVAAAVACAPARDAAPGAVAVDDFGDTARIAAPATRIVSLNPVTTELLFAMGAGDRLVGRTTWDLYPEAATRVTDVGNGMQPNVEAVLGQRPDLVILYASESNRAAAAQFRRAGVHTLTYRTDHIADLPRITAVFARALGLADSGAAAIDTVIAALDSLRALPPRAKAPRAFFYVWDVPLLTIGKGSYLNELLELAGGENVFGDVEAPSPQVALEEIARRDPDVILVGPNNAAKVRAHAAWQSVRAVREGRLLVIDTTIVGRPGVRMAEGARHLRALLDSASRP